MRCGVSSNGSSRNAACRARKLRAGSATAAMAASHNRRRTSAGTSASGLVGSGWRPLESTKQTPVSAGCARSNHSAAAK